MATLEEILQARGIYWDALAEVNALSSQRTRAIETRAHTPEYIQDLNDQIEAARSTMFVQRTAYGVVLAEPLDP